MHLFRNVSFAADILKAPGTQMCAHQYLKNKKQQKKQQQQGDNGTAFNTQQLNNFEFASKND